MPNPYFRVVLEDGNGGRYLADEMTAGPWHPGSQHGGPPNALAVRVAERCAAAETGRTDLVASRIASEFVGPVPVGEVEVRGTVARVARSAVLVTVTTLGGGRECLTSRVWLVAAGDTTALVPPLRSDGVPPARPSGRPPSFGLRFPYGDSIDWHEMAGSITQPGPGAVWARPRHDLLAGESWTGLQRVAFLGDSASGVSSMLDWTQWSFLNVDLDLHLVRPTSADWLYLDAVTQLGTAGAAVARSVISDEQGPIAYGLQTLVVAGVRR